MTVSSAEIEAGPAVLRFNVANRSDLPLDIESIWVQVFTCRDGSPMLADRVLAQRRIQLGEVVLKKGGVKSLTDGDVIYTVEPSATGFFSVNMDASTIRDAKVGTCHSPSKDPFAYRQGDLMLYVKFMNPRTGLIETSRTHFEVKIPNSDFDSPYNWDNR